MTLQAKLGIKKVGVVKSSPKAFKDRAKAIRLLVEKNEVRGEKRRKLLNQASWYAWKAGQIGKKSKRRA